MDSVQVGQFMISRPVFAGALLGLINGCLLQGILLGLFIELVYSDELPVGGSVPPNGVAATTVAVASYSLIGTTLPVSFFVGIIFGAIYALFEKKIRAIRSVWNKSIETQLETGNYNLQPWIRRSLITESMCMLTVSISGVIFAWCISYLQGEKIVQQSTQFTFSLIPILGLFALYFRFKKQMSGITINSAPVESCNGAVQAKDKRVLNKMFVRSFFIQACWNYERFQNVGFLNALLPFLNMIYTDKEALKKAALRNFTVINTQPYMASFLLGSVARMEQDLLAGRNEINTERFYQMKQALASGYASIGDRIFWGRLKPLTLQLCMAVWLICGFYGWMFDFTLNGKTPSDFVLLLGPVLSVITYSIVAVYIRRKGLLVGYDCGEDLGCGLQSYDWAKIIRRLTVFGFVFSSALILSSIMFFLIKNHSIRYTNTDLLIKVGTVFAVIIMSKLFSLKGRGLMLTVFVVLGAAFVFALFGVNVANFSL